MLLPHTAYSPNTLPLPLFFFFNDTATTEIYTLSLPRRSSDLLSAPWNWWRGSNASCFDDLGRRFPGGPRGPLRGPCPGGRLYPVSGGAAAGGDAPRRLVARPQGRFRPDPSHATVRPGVVPGRRHGRFGLSPVHPEQRRRYRGIHCTVSDQPW